MPEMSVTCPNCQVVIHMAEGPKGKSVITCPKCRGRVDLGLKPPPPPPPGRRVEQPRHRPDPRWEVLAEDTRDPEHLFGEELWGTMGLVGVGAALVALCFIGGYTATVSVIVMFILALILGLWAGIWLLIIAFQEDPLQGILCLFVPLYGVYYIISRWSDCFRTLLPYGGSILMVGMIILGAIIGKVSTVKQELDEHGVARGGRGGTEERDIFGRVRRSDDTPPPPVERSKISGVARDDANFIDLALEDLRSNNPRHRREAAQALAEMRVNAARRTEVARALEDACSDTTADVRGAALKALSVWGDKQHAQRFLEGLRSKNHDAVLAAVDFFSRHRDERALEPLVEVMDNHPDEVKRVLKDYGPAAEKALLKGLEHPSARVRSECCVLLREFSSSDAKSGVTQALQDKDDSVREAAVEYFRKHKHEPAIEGLAECLPKHRQAAADALRKQGAEVERHLISVLEKITDEDELDRRMFIRRGDLVAEICRLLQEMGTKDCVLALREIVLRRSRSAEAAREALKSIARRYPKDFPADKPIDQVDALSQAIADLKSKDPFRRGKKEAFATLLKTDPKERRVEVFAALEPYLDKDANIFDRREAIKPYAAWATEREFEKLMEMFDERGDHEVNLAIIPALGRLKKEIAIPPLVAAMKDHRYTKECAAALKGFGVVAQRPVSLLIKDDVPRPVRLEACRLIGEIGDKDAILAMTNLSKQTKDKELAAVATQALKDIQTRVKAMEDKEKEKEKK